MGLYSTDKNAKTMKHLFLALGLLLTHSFPCMAKNDSIRNFANTVNRFNKVFPQEKVYLHLDNTGYFKNEKIWFKAYITRTDNDSLGSMSKVLYVELINPYGDIEKSVKLPILDGQAHGDIDLAELLNSGFYEIRAYTRYMLNWGTDAIFSRVIPIFEAPATEGDYSKPAIATRIPDRIQPVKRVVADEGNKKVNVNFYPEGGKFVRGLPGRMAFSVTDKNGAGIKAACQFKKDGTFIGHPVETNEDGRAVIETGADNSGLELVIQTAAGYKKTVELPSPEESGCSLVADMTDGDSITIKLSCTPNLYRQGVGIVWLNRGHLYDCKESILSENGLCLRFGCGDRRGGVNQIAVIDKHGEILASRMVFVYPSNDMSEISFQIPDTTLSRNIKLVARTVPNSCFSMSVTDASSQTGGWYGNIATWHLLTSDIKGYIKNPEYYFESDDSEHRRNADLLMLVQGWKRYDLKMMEGKANFNLLHPVEKSLLIDGKLKPRSKKNKVDLVDLSVMLLNTSGDRLYGQTRTNQNGNFAFAMPDCYRSWTMIIMTAKESKFRNYHVGINRHFSPALRNVSPLETEQLELEPPAFTVNRFKDNNASGKMDGVLTLQEVDVVAKKWTSARQAWESEDRGALNALIKYDCEKDADNIIDRGEEVPTLIDYLKQKNPLIDGNDNLSGSYGKNEIFNAFYNDGPSYDRMPIIWIVNNSFLGGTSFFTRVSRRNSASPDMLDPSSDESTVYFPTSLDEVKRVYISFGGNDWKRFLPAIDLIGENIVTIYVYTTGNAGMRYGKGVRLTYFDGYNLSSSYEENMLAGIRPDRDYRRTLYWNPDVKADTNGEATIEFTNNTKGTMFCISAEGMTADGKVCCNK